MHYKPSPATNGLRNLYLALHITNKQYAQNIAWKREPELIGKHYAFTLTVHDSANPGSRRAASGRRISAACWHAHRDFFRALFKHDPEGTVTSTQARYTSSANFEHHFEDTGTQSISNHPFILYRDACDCQEQPE